jgi:two-component system sensor kinase FixL
MSARSLAAHRGQPCWPLDDKRNVCHDAGRAVRPLCCRIEDEGWRKRKDGSLFWGNVVLTLVQDEHGTPRGVSMVTKDITERKKAENQLLESEARTRAILAAAVDAMIIIDEHGIGSGLEVVGLRKNGETFPMDLAVSEVKMGERRVFTGIVRDITERAPTQRSWPLSADGHCHLCEG